MKKNIKITLLVFVSFFLISFGGDALASSTSGVVDPIYKYAWSENVGWLNFGTSEGNIVVSDSGLTGYFWGENIGWVSLNCSNDNSCSSVDYAVENDGYGNLSGYAWSENTGWINFNPDYGGVTIDTSGNFSGYAYSESTGWIVFNCITTDSCSSVDYKIKTDWRPISARSQCNNSLDDDNDGLVDYPNDQGCGSLEDNDETDPVFGGGIISGLIPNPNNFVEEIVPNVPEILEDVFKDIQDVTRDVAKKITEGIKKTPIIGTIWNIFNTDKTEETVDKLVSKDTPLSMRGQWDLMSSFALEKFVLAPLPKEIRVLAQKFPEFEKTLEEVGVRKLTDIEKLREAKLILPSLAKTKGLPIGELTLEEKKKIPTEIVFAKTSGHMIDFDIVLSLNDKNRIEQKITTISGKPLQLTVKPENPVKSVRGYVVLKPQNHISKSDNENGIISKLSFPIQELMASVVFSDPVFAREQKEIVEIENKLVLLEFEYTDPDSDGIYTAEIQMPVVEGEYEIITVLDFYDEELGRKEIRLIAVVDPEGYVYEKFGKKEIRIPDVVVSIYRLDSNTNEYVLWPAKEYQQENPQTTDVTGKYSFLVPEGMYYLKAEAKGYSVYESEYFQVESGRGVHMNIELKSKYYWLKIFDWKIALLLFVVVLLSYNFYRDKIRENLLNQKIK
ncbi:MAG: carboxypeptidase-like regulatory domain-containing protein [Candidatus Pacebacteria bacterium]|nr:carboxypeptidase-like regulatory domain-containing protein [Candidatus Paceibacterota bacterium]